MNHDFPVSCSTVERRLKREGRMFPFFTMAVIVVTKGKGAEGHNQKVSFLTSFFGIDSTDVEKTFSLFLFKSPFSSPVEF